MAAQFGRELVDSLLIIGIAVLGAKGGVWTRCGAWAAGAMASTWTTVYSQALASHLWEGIREKASALASSAVTTLADPGSVVVIALVVATMAMNRRPNQPWGSPQPTPPPVGAVPPGASGAKPAPTPVAPPGRRARAVGGLPVQTTGSRRP